MSILKLDPYSIFLVLSNQHRLVLCLSLKYKSLKLYFLQVYMLLVVD